MGAVVAASAVLALTAAPALAQETPGSTEPPTSSSAPVDPPTSTTTEEPAPEPTEPPESSQPEDPQPEEPEPTDPPEEPEDPEPEPGAGAIQERYEALTPEEREQLGAPQGEEVVESESLRWQAYANGRFYWTPERGVTAVYGGIYVHFLSLGAHGTLGVPVADEQVGEGGSRYSDFDDDGALSAIYWTPAHGAHLISGPVLEHYRALGADLGFGVPTTDTAATPDSRGTYNHFVTPSGHGASIYSTGETGTHAVQGAIRDKWAASGWEQGPLGYPTTDETDAGDGVGKYSMFSGDGTYPAGIVWSPQTGAHSVQGVIAEHYVGLGGPAGVLGYPTTDETATPGGTGRYNHFTGTGGASIYWSAGTGAHEVYGGIRAHWANLGWERSYLGFPISGEHEVEVGRAVEFQGGIITWNRETGAVVDTPR